ncbi:MAG: DUF721 domain-containing protein [Acidimicrobiales bacterium]
MSTPPRPGGRPWRAPDPVTGRTERRRPRDPAPVGEALDRVLAGLGAPCADVLAAVFERWSVLAGRPLADHAVPASLERGVLTVVVDDPAWATEARYRAATLRARCTTELGPGVVLAVEVRVRRR